MKPTICFDLNKTLINENSWLNLNLALGITKEEDDTLMNWNSRGIISDAEGQQILLKLYQSSQKHTKQYILSILSQYTYLPNAVNVVSELQKRGYPIVLISGAMDILVEKVAKELGIKHWYSNNRFVFDKNDMLQNIITIDNDYLVKAHQLDEHCRNFKVPLSDVFCVGDGANDAEIFKMTKRGITFTGSKISNIAWKTIDGLDELLSIFP